MSKQKLIVLTGAGISAESGIKTFRDSNGLWENHNIEDVATLEAFICNPSLVLKFYNERRANMYNARPNSAHLALVSLEQKYAVHIITQNVDDLHERAGSKSILHLHGELTKCRSVKNNNITYFCNKDIKLGDIAPDGGQLRPHIVWFGEAVPAMENAITLAKQADILLIIGTSLQVYPAASLLHYVSEECKIIIIDPHISKLNIKRKNITIISATATQGMQQLLHDYL